MAIVSAYPALLLGLFAGVVLGRRRWSSTPALIAGSVVFVLLVAHRSVGTAVVSVEGGGAMTPPLWLLLAVVNAGCWCLGIGMGVVAGRPRLPR